MTYKHAGQAREFWQCKKCRHRITGTTVFSPAIPNSIPTNCQICNIPFTEIDKCSIREDRFEEKCPRERREPPNCPICGTLMQRKVNHYFAHMTPEDYKLKKKVDKLTSIAFKELIKMGAFTVTSLQIRFLVKRCIKFPALPVRGKIETKVKTIVEEHPSA